jgi:hypothetical protein
MNSDELSNRVTLEYLCEKLLTTDQLNELAERIGTTKINQLKDELEEARLYEGYLKSRR